MSATTASSGSNQKVPKFAAKAGFVIPKNKLSGSLVPIFRGVKNPGGNDLFNGESTKHTPRKSKWGPDLTQDAAVRRGRALAYQTRVDQITQLKSTILEIEGNGNSVLASQSPDHGLYGHQIDNEKLEELELEKREAVGEILKLNPSYKAPSDYKPLLKEARISIPFEEYPGYNFVGLIYGPGGDNQKRLEKETGAKIQVYGTKVDNGQKVEIKPSDGNEFHNAYEELFVNISAETFEKVDAAVSVIELLLSSVSGNLAASATSNSASADDVNVPLVLNVATSDPVHSLMQMVPGPAAIPPQGQFQYPGQWFPAGPSNNALHSPSGLIPPPNSSAIGLNARAHVSASPFKPSNMPSPFGPPPPVPVVGFNSNLQNPSLIPSEPLPPAQVLQHPYMAQTSAGPFGPPRNPSSMAPSVPANNTSAPFPSTGNQLSSIGITRPLMPILPQPVSSLPQGSLPASTPASAGFSNMINMAPRNLPTHGPHPIVSQPVPVSISGSFVSPTLGSAPNPSPGPPMQSGIHSSVSGSVANFTPVKPPLLTSPGSGSFTFQPHRPQNPASHAVPRPSNQFAAQNAPPTNPILQSPASQPMSLRLPMPNLTPQPVNHGFSRPHVGNQMGQPQSNMSVVPFARNPTGISGPSRFPTFPDASTLAPRNQILPVGPRNFGRAPQMPSLPGPLPSRPGNHVQLQNYAVQINPSFASGRSAPSPGEQQLYDPFSPTSMPITPQHQGGFPRR